MYDHFRGEVLRARGTSAVLLTGGIGYEFRVPIRVAAGLRRGDQATLFTILHVVDGNPSLLGFAEESERELARAILSVSGVGPSIALAVLSTYSPAETAAYLRRGDAKAMQKVKGIGGKTAERLCLELRDKVDRLDLGEQPDLPPAAAEEEPTASLPTDAADAVLALVTLGYAEADATKKVVKLTAAQPDLDTETLIKLVLLGG